MDSASYRIVATGVGQTVALAGDWTSLTLGPEAAGFGEALPAKAEGLHLDLSALGRVDTAGAYAMLRSAPAGLAAAAALARPDLVRLFELVRPAVDEQAAAAAPRPAGLMQFFERIGRALVAFKQEAWRASVFAGRVVSALGSAIRHPSRVRAVSLAHAMEAAGTSALPIICVMNFFIGAVVALVGTNLLASLGVAVFTVQLVGVAVLREFGVLITAILLAGRSASSFAAQIGSMKMNQETDAMQVIGVSEIDALVIPRVLAMLLMMPLLVFAAMVAGILGGLIVSWLALDMSPIFFFERMRETVSVRHFWIGMSKVPLLAFLIAMAGCRHGLSVGGDVESLGERVTMAVVQAIFVIILFDAIFAVIFMELNL
jgi:phospholipid/cholesterol/gamma-HCH transport system permease protein